MSNKYDRHTGVDKNVFLPTDYEIEQEHAPCSFMPAVVLSVAVVAVIVSVSWLLVLVFSSTAS